jgi:D-3-phosphoglycerate dehydrogenase
MNDTTTRRDLLIAGLVATAAGVASAPAGTPARFRVAVAGDYENLALKHAPWNSLGDDAEVVSFNKPFRSSQEAIRALRDFDAVALMRERVPMPREVLEHLPRLKLIVFSGLMDETLDHAAAKERNIIVCKSMPAQPGPRVQGGGGAPSELALTLMLACARQIPAADALIRSGGWAFQPGIPLRGKVLGIVGYGGIGKPVARYGQALGMSVVGFSRSLTDEVARAEGVSRADLETLLRTSDVISIHLPLTSATTGMIGAREIGWMKPGVILVNTARAPIVDEQPVIEALRTRKIAMAGFDVFWKEPLPANHPLLKLPNVVMTPHVGYVTEDAMAARYKDMVEVLAAYRQGTVKGRYTPPAEL